MFRSAIYVWGSFINGAEEKIGSEGTEESLGLKGDVKKSGEL